MKYNTCIGVKHLGKMTQEEIDAYGKANDLTITYADWHPNPEYRISQTGTFLSKNEEYPSGLILVDNKGKPHPFKNN